MLQLHLIASAALVAMIGPAVLRRRGGVSESPLTVANTDGLRPMCAQHSEPARMALPVCPCSAHDGWSLPIDRGGVGACGTCALEASSHIVCLAARAHLTRIVVRPLSGTRRATRLVSQGDAFSTGAGMMMAQRNGPWGAFDDAFARARAAVADLARGRATPPSKCTTCAGSGAVPCPNCEGQGWYVAMGDVRVECKCCRGSGQVLCRACYDGDPWSLEEARARARRRPD